MKALTVFKWAHAFLLIGSPIAWMEEHRKLHEGLVMADGWHVVDEYLPDWHDSGIVQLKFADGSIVELEQTIGEVWTGEDEYPMAEHWLDAECRQPVYVFFDAVEWRMKPQSRAGL